MDKERLNEEKSPLAFFSLKNFLFVLPLMSLVGIVFILNTYSPLEIGPVGILIVFTLFYIFCLSIIFIIFTIVQFVLSQLLNRSFGALSTKKAYYLSSVLGFLPVFLLALNSIGQLQVGDVALVLLLIVFASFYVNRRAS